MFENFSLTWRNCLDIALVTLFFYYILHFVRGTRALAVLQGLVLLLAIYIFSRVANLFTFSWLLENFFGSLFLVLVILFSDDIKKGLARITFRSIFKKREAVNKSFIRELSNVCFDLAKVKIGAIIVIECNVPLGDYLGKGVKLDSLFSADLIQTIFFPNTALHDGAVILTRDARVVAASCVLPLAQINERKHYGTRHRAALGVTELTDAVAIVVSEERGAVCIAHEGQLSKPLNYERMERILTNVLK